jgi:hypothetical protein
MALTDTYQQLVRERAETAERLNKIDRALASMKDLIVVMPDEQIDGPYVNMRPLEAAEHFVRQLGRPASTGEIARALRGGGLRTQSRNLSASLYASMAKANKNWTRTTNGEWELKHAKS